MFNPYDIVYTVLITEKATASAEKFQRYAFKVNPKPVSRLRKTSWLSVSMP